MIHFRRLISHQVQRAPSCRFHSSSTVFPKKAQVILSTHAPLLDYKPPQDPDVAWKKLRTWATEGNLAPGHGALALSRVKVAIDGKLIWSYEKDPDSEEVNEWKGVWPDRGEMFSRELAITAPTQCRLTYDDNNWLEESRPDLAENKWRLDWTLFPFCLTLLCVIYHAGAQARRSTTVEPAGVVPDQGGDTGPSAIGKSTIDEKSGESVPRQPGV